jgi:methionyl-tRNA formyltransferase
MRVEREMDTGPVALQRELEIGADETAGALRERIAALTADALADALDRIAEERVVWTPQDDSLATAAPKIERSDAALDWNESAVMLARRVRAFAPAPGAFCQLAGEPLRILAAHSEPGAALPSPGTVTQDGALRIATGEGWLVPLRLQRAGGKPLDTAAFLRGRPIPDGMRLT